MMGLAYVGSVCSRDHDNLGVAAIHSHSTEKTFYAFAHELGHAFGADHSFEEGEGTTGGIMDYGDGRLGGIYQFNTKYRKIQMCAVANAHVNRCLGKFQRAPDGATARPPPAPPSKDDVCLTVGRKGVGGGKRCSFPFIYKEKTYHSCTIRDNFDIWCATLVDWGDVAVPGQWAECPWTPGCIGPHRLGFGLLEWLRMVPFLACVAFLLASFWRFVREYPRVTCTAKSSGQVIGAETPQDVAASLEEPASDDPSDDASLPEEHEPWSDSPPDGHPGALSLLEEIEISAV